MYYRSLYWHVSEMEEKMAERAHKDKQEIMVKMEELGRMIERQGTKGEIQVERVVRAVKDTARERRYTRKVLKSVDEMDGAAERIKTKEEEYKKEERRIVEDLRKGAANLEAVRGMSRTLKSRRKTRPEAPRPMRMEAQVAAVENYMGDGSVDVDMGDEDVEVISVE